MPKKINLSSSRKEYIKQNFSDLNPSDMTGENLRYYNLVKAGHKAAEKNFRFEGKFLSRKADVYKLIEKFAEKKGVTVDKYVSENKDQIENYIQRGYVKTEHGVNKTIDTIEEKKGKYVYVDDGNGIVRVSKAEAIEALALFQQMIASNSTIVHIETSLKTYDNGKTVVKIPARILEAIQSGEELTEEELEEILDEEGISYIKSAKKK